MFRLRNCLLLSVSATLIAATLGAGDFGIRPVYPETSLAQLFAKTEHYDGKTVRLAAKIQDVCQKKGCWMVVTDGDHTMRVRFKDYSFFVPRDVSGKHVILEGVIQIQNVTDAEAKHYASETKSRVSAQPVRGGKTIGMMAEGVWIEGAEAPGGKAPMSSPESGSAEAGSGSNR